MLENEYCHAEEVAEQYKRVFCRFAVICTTHGKLMEDQEIPEDRWKFLRYSLTPDPPAIILGRSMVIESDALFAVSIITEVYLQTIMLSVTNDNQG
jgi:hypothetical protein